MKSTLFLSLEDQFMIPFFPRSQEDFSILKMIRRNHMIRGIDSNVIDIGPALRNKPPCSPARIGQPDQVEHLEGRNTLLNLFRAYR